MSVEKGSRPHGDPQPTPSYSAWKQQQWQINWMRFTSLVRFFWDSIWKKPR